MYNKLDIIQNFEFSGLGSKINLLIIDEIANS